jgi:hypothetical protein
LILLFTMISGVVSHGAERVIEIHAGDAFQTLQKFAAETGANMVFSQQQVEGVNTHYVSGKMEPSEALQKMIHETPLGMYFDDASGAIMVFRKKNFSIRSTVRDPGGNPGVESKTNPKHQEPNEMKINDAPKRKLFGALISALLVGASPGVTAQNASTPTDDEDVYVLSPFEVSVRDDSGYFASSTLSGTRLRTPLSDIGAAVTAVTKEFLEDTGVNNIAELMTYVVSGEGGGLTGNFAGGGDIVGGLIEEDSSRRRPQTATRVRGLINADLSRNFFQTDIPMDSYNIDRVDISRGPNAVLFGLGSPAGLADSSLIRAILTDNRSTLQTRLGMQSSYRASIDHNQVLVEDRWAARVAVLHDHTKYRQRPAYSKDQRVFLTTRGMLFKTDTATTVVSANYEQGKIEAIRPRLQAPIEQIKGWFIAGQPQWNASIGVGTPGQFNPFFPPNEGEILYDLVPKPIDYEFYDLRRLLYVNPNVFWQLSPIYEANGQGPSMVGHQVRRPPAANTPGVPGNPRSLEFFGTRSEAYFSSQLRDASIPKEMFDFEKKLLSGKQDLAEIEFRALNVVLEQNFFNNRLGFEVAYDTQIYEDDFNSPFGIERTSRIQIDVNTHFTDGRVNPNFGRPFMVAWESGPRNGETERETWRATGYASFDFADVTEGLWSRILGRHTLTTLLGKQTLQSEEYQRRLGYIGENVAFDMNESNIVNQRRLVSPMVYVGPSVYGVPYEQVRFDFDLSVRLPKDGDTFQLMHYDRRAGKFREGTFTAREAISSAFLRKENIENYAAVLQSYWLNEHLITTVGWRKDRTEPFVTVDFPTIPAGNELQGSIDLDSLVMEPVTPISGEIWSYSVVLKQPRNLKLPWGSTVSLHYNESENFQPIAGQVDVFGRDIAPPAGSTREMGALITLLDNRMFFRINRYKTDISNSRQGSGIGPSHFNEILNVDFQTLQFWFEAYNGGSPFVTMDHIRQLEASIPESVKQLVNYRLVTAPDGTMSPQFNYPLNSMSDVTSFRSEGWEFELTANVTKNWRLTANAAKVEAFRSETAPYLSEFVEGRLATWRESSLSQLIRNPAGVDPTNPVAIEGAEKLAGTANRIAIPRINNLQAQDGTASLNLRKWRFNLVTNYTFNNDSRLKGFGVGGAYRWQDKMVVSYPQFVDEMGVVRPDLKKPFMGKSEGKVDFWISYKGRQYRGVDWRVQLNVRNVFADGDLIPVTVNNDGSTAAFRASEPRDFSLSATFEF